MEEGTIYFKLLGGFSYRTDRSEAWRRLDESVPGSGGKKLRSFLEYLIVHHNREIATPQLVEQFWPETSSNAPGNALKHTMHKARILLKAMFPDHKNLIVTQRGVYVWDKNIRIILDTEMFEQWCITDRGGLTTQNLTQILEAIALYDGDLLPGNDDDWIQPLRTYLHTLYINMCKNALNLLQQENRWTEMVGICERAYALEPGGRGVYDSFYSGPYGTRTAGTGLGAL